MPDSCIDIFIKNNQAAAGYKAEEVSVGQRVRAELDLLRVAPAEVWTGAKDRVCHLIAHPGEALTMAGTAAAFGAVVTTLARGSKVGFLVAKSAGVVFGAAGAGDLMLRCRSPIAGAWAHPDDASYRQEFGRGLGAFGVDMLGMGLAGYGGGRLAMMRPGAIAGATNTAKNLNTLVDALESGQPKLNAALKSPDFESNLLLEAGNFQPPKVLPVVTAETKRLTTALNQWRAESGVPEGVLCWKADRIAEGHYTPGTARVTVDAKFLIQKRGSQRADITAHELTHADQDGTMLRRLADRLGIGVSASPRETQALTKAYIEAVLWYPEEGWMSNVLSMRKGQPLSPAQAARADALLAEQPQVRETLKALAESRELREYVGYSRFKLRQTPEVLFEELLAPATRQKLFGAQPGALTARLAAELQPHFQRQRPFSAAEIEALTPKLDSLLYRRSWEARYEYWVAQLNYRAPLSEREAYSVGSQAGWLQFFGRPSSQVFLAAGATAAGDAVWKLGSEYAR